MIAIIFELSSNICNKYLLSTLILESRWEDYCTNRALGECYRVFLSIVKAAHSFFFLPKMFLKTF